MNESSRLRQLARAALLRAKGDVSAAIAPLDEAIIKANDIALERELTANFRHYALRAVLHHHLTDLRQEGRLPREQAEPTTSAADWSRAPSWAVGRVKDMEERKETRRRNYLDSFLINGEPIGDLTPEVVLARADRHERDAHFMRLIASGVPHGRRIRDYVTQEEAEERWQMAQAAPVRTDVEARQAGILKMLTRGRNLSPDEYEAASRRVAELQRLDKPSAWDNFEMDALARVMSEYDAEQR